jgi:SAM-dependent methyltransferase
MWQALRTRLIWALDPMFPPMPDAYMDRTAQCTYEVAKAPASMGAYLARLGRTDLDVLDFGCGPGGETRWLAARVRSVIGVDIDPDAIAQARAHAAPNTRFVESLADVPDASVDAIVSTNVFEHVMDLPATFRALRRVLRPGGHLISEWGPLFYSPFGYHLRWACQVPYAHLVGGLPAIVALRTARARYPPGPITSWQDVGLNGATPDDYQRAILHAGFEVREFTRIPVKGFHLGTCLPYASRWFTFGLRAHLIAPCRHAQSAANPRACDPRPAGPRKSVGSRGHTPRPQ